MAKRKLACGHADHGHTDERVCVSSGIAEDGSAFVDLEIGSHTLQMPPETALEIASALWRAAAAVNAGVTDDAPAFDGPVSTVGGRG